MQLITTTNYYFKMSDYIMIPSNDQTDKYTEEYPLKYLNIFRLLCIQKNINLAVYLIMRDICSTHYTLRKIINNTNYVIIVIIIKN